MLSFHKNRAFTLIELMIVVAIIAGFSAILVPNLIRAREKSRQKLQTVVARAKIPRPTGQSPVLESVDLTLKMEVRPLRVGLDVANRYQLEQQGTYRWSAAGSGQRLILFELPSGVDQVEGLMMQQRRGQEWLEPTGVIYGDSFVAWEAPASDFPMETRLAYGASGKDRMSYLWPQASKVSALRATLEIGGGVPIVLPLGSLQPTTQNGDEYTWTLNNALSPAPIAIELSTLDSPLGRAGTLFRLTGLAVLLFGAGFWYLAELYRAGSLKNFGFGSFMLLALTYSSFFVSVAVLSIDGRFSTATDLVGSLALCLPLLSYHVSQLIDRRFALTRALPLAAFTLSMVLLGVYGGPWRSLGLLAFALGILAFLTTTYRPFQATIEQRRQRQEQLLQKTSEGFTQKKLEGRRLESTLVGRLEGVGRPLGDTLTGHLRSRVKALGEALESSPSQNLGSLDWHRDRLEQAIDLASETYQQILTLEEEAETHAEREAAEQQPPSVAKSSPHCCYCGSTDQAGRFCGDCGGRLPLVRSCLACQSEQSFPVHLLPSGQAYHCRRCGQTM